jgi:hypothetical protein
VIASLLALLLAVQLSLPQLFDQALTELFGSDLV